MFEPMNFIENLRYMGLGMLGIFIVIGVIVLSGIVILLIRGRKRKAEEE